MQKGRPVMSLPDIVSPASLPETAAEPPVPMSLWKIISQLRRLLMLWCFSFHCLYNQMSLASSPGSQDLAGKLLQVFQNSGRATSWIPDRHLGQHRLSLKACWDSARSGEAMLTFSPSSWLHRIAGVSVKSAPQLWVTKAGDPNALLTTVVYS